MKFPHRPPAPEGALRPGLFLALLLGLLPAPSLSARPTPVVDEFEQAEKEATELDELHQFLELHLKLGHASEAESYARKILAKNPGDADALGAMLGFYLERANAKQALSYAKRYRAVRPGAEADAMYASTLRMNGRKEEALAIMQRRYAKVKKGAHFPQLLELCYCYYDCGKIAQAKGCFRKLQGDRRFTARQRAEAGRELAAIQRDEDIRDAYLALEDRDFEKARAIHDKIAGSLRKPTRDVTALRAVLDAEQYGRIDEAVGVFEKLKASHKGPAPFPYQSTYAMLLFHQGNFLEAEKTAEEAAATKSPLLTAEDARGQLDNLRTIREVTRPTLAVEGLYQDQNEGSAYRGKMAASLPVNRKRTRVGVEYQFNELDLETRTPGAGETNYHTALATLRHRFTSQLAASIAAGVSGGEFAYRIAAHMKRPGRDDSVELRFDGGRRPTDSLLLEALGAEERRLTLKGEAEVPKQRRARVRGEVFLREIDLDQSGISELGNGWGARWEAEYLFYQYQRATLAAAYVGAVEGFDFSDSATAMAPFLPYDPRSLVEDDYHAHGIVVRGRAPVGHTATAFAELGAQYRFDSEEMVYSIIGGAEWWLADFTRLDLSAAYYTSGTTAGSSGSGYFEGHLGVTSTF